MNYLVGYFEDNKWEVARRPSKAKILAKALGGKWKYDGVTSWWCDDNKRHVSRCAAGHEDDGWAPSYYLYITNEPAKVLFWKDNGISLI